jgi:hypothetical protein
MAGSFPTLKSGNTVFYPLADTMSFGTQVHKFLDDSEQRHRDRLVLRRFQLTCNNISAYDVSLIRSFFRSQFGGYDSTWDLTFGGVTYSNMAFAQDNFPSVESKHNRMTLSFQLVQTKSSNPTIPTTPTYFPQLLSGGVSTAMPYESMLEYRTITDELENGKRYAYKWRDNPLGKFKVNLSLLTDTEAANVRSFLLSVEGRLQSFIFLDPGGNLVGYSDLLSDSSWTKTSVTVGSAVADPFGGSLATSCLATSGDSKMVASVLPAGNASGFVLCASAWVRATGSGQTLRIGFQDSTATLLGSTTWTLPQNQWIRIFHSITLGTNNPVSIIIGGGSTWNSSTIQFFSLQCVPLPGPGPRLLTPGADALRPKCRLGSDDSTINYLGVNQQSTTILIEEFS